MDDIFELFPVAINIYSNQISMEVSKWAWDLGLFSSIEEYKSYKKQGINFFAPYLFPQLSLEDLRRTMKFFLCLFLLDDHLEQIDPDEGINWINGLSNKENEMNLNPLLIQIQVLTIEMMKVSSDQKWKNGWMENWNYHLEGLLWEINNKSKGRIPELRDYQIQRPFASGVFLAIHLLRMETFEDSLKVRRLEWDVSRLIVLSNDLGSSDKERSLGDFHNELLLLERIVGPIQAKVRMKNEIKRLCTQIIQVGTRIKKESEKMEPWLGSMMLLVGGCHYWSQYTTRYFEKINGEMKR